MEKNIRNAIVDHLWKKKSLSTDQHEFKRNRSCVTQLLECIDDWTKAIDDNKEVDIIYLDFKAAFDKVPHKRLLAKIWNLGIQGNIYNWVKSFLEDRHQRVIVNGTKSNWRKVTSGVPQGSVLGPVLFLIFINDLPDTINCTLKFFADDTELYKVINTNEDSKNIQENIYKACDWATKWQMTFNTKKCKIMHIGPKKLRNTLQKTQITSIRQ